jgi:aspartyl protease family protein
MSAGGQIFWLAAIVAGVAFVAPSLQPADPKPAAPQAAAETVEDEPAPIQIGNGYASQELVRSPDGHFYAEAQVNGAQVRFMIDTGASFVVLTREDAQRAGISLGGERSTAIGVGGEVEVTPVTIDRVAVGSLAATGVQGAVADELNVSLLGQSFLAQVGTVEIRDDRMVLR